MDISIYFDENFDSDVPDNGFNFKSHTKRLRHNILKYIHLYLHDSMLTKINTFDDSILSLGVKRNDVKFCITFLELFALTLEEELLILYDFDLLEDDYAYNIHEKTAVQNSKVEKVIIYFHKPV